jgi:hypothetical protein
MVSASNASSYMVMFGSVCEAEIEFVVFQAMT